MHGSPIEFYTNALHKTDGQTDRQTDRQTVGQTGPTAPDRLWSPLQRRSEHVREREITMLLPANKSDRICQ